MSERGKLCAQVKQTVQCSVLVEHIFSTSSQGRLYVPYYLLMRFLDELCRNDSFSCWCIHFLLQLPVQHLVSRGLRAPVKAKPGWSVTRPIPFQLSNRCKHINIHTQKRSPLPSTANTHTHTHTQTRVLYLVCGPLYLHRHDEVCITNRLEGEHRGGNGWHAHSHEPCSVHSHGIT